MVYIIDDSGMIDFMSYEATSDDFRCASLFVAKKICSSSSAVKMMCGEEER